MMTVKIMKRIRIFTTIYLFITIIVITSQTLKNDNYR